MATYTSAMRRALARPFIFDAIDKGLSANKTLSMLRGITGPGYESGLGYRRQDFLADFRILKGSAEFRQWYINAGKPENIPSRLIKERPSKIPKRWIYKFRIHGYDREAEKEVDRYITVGSDTELTASEAMAYGQQKHEEFLRGARGYDFEFQYINLVDVYKHEGYE